MQSIPFPVAKQFARELLDHGLPGGTLDGRRGEYSACNDQFRRAMHQGTPGDAAGNAADRDCGERFLLPVPFLRAVGKPCKMAELACEV